MLRVTDFMFNDHALESAAEYDSWQPEDPCYLDEWVKVLVGQEDGEGHWFQVHLCTHASISRIDKKEYLFPVSYWESIDDLIVKLDKYIFDTLPNNLNLENENDYGLAMQNLSKHWHWEYANYA